MREAAHWTIRGKLYAAFLLIVAASLISTAVNEVLIHRIEHAAEVVALRAAELQSKAGELRVIVADTRRLAADSMVLQDQSLLYQTVSNANRFYALLAEMAGLVRENVELMHEYYGYGLQARRAEHSLHTVLMVNLDAVHEDFSTYLRGVLVTAADHIEGLVFDDAQYARLQAQDREFNDQFDVILDQIQKLVAQDVSVMAQTLAAARYAMYAAVAFIIAVTLLIMLVINRSLSRPLARVAQFVSAYGRHPAGGAQRIEHGGKDEIGQLSAGINHMLDSIASITVAREDLAHAKAEVEHASRAKSEFLSSMSHELRTPLNAVLGYAQLLAAEAGSLAEHELREFAHNIEISGKHLLSLIEDVLDLEKIEARRMEVKVEEVDVAEAVATALTLLRPQAQAMAVELRAVAADAAGSRVRADSFRLQQVLLNIVSNAIKYNRRGGSVTITTRARADARLEIVVADTGAGLSTEEQARLFQPFERLRYKNSNIQGSGIGLVISQHLVELMQGSIEVDSRRGEGSEFRIILPAASATPSAVPVAEQARRLSVLCLERDPAAIRLFGMLLQRCGDLQLLVADTQALAVQMAVSLQPDVIVADVNLPDFDAAGLRASLRAGHNTAGIPLLALVADGRQEQLLRQHGHEFAAYLRKPLALAALQQALSRCLRLSSSLPALPVAEAGL